MKVTPFVAALMLAACGGLPPLPPPPASPPPITAPSTRIIAAESPLQTPDAPFRENPPEAGPAVPWSAPIAKTWTLASGVHVLLVEQHDLPIVSLRIVAPAGAGDLGLPAASVTFTGALLEQGAGARSALSISDDLQALGVMHGAGCDWDACSARIKVLTSRLGPALDILSDIVLRPTFPDVDIERTRKSWLASLQQEKNSPSVMEQNAIAATVFGRRHPYAHGLRGTAAEIMSLTRKDVLRAFSRMFTPHGTTIVVAGDVTQHDLQNLLEARFSAWKGPAAPRFAVPSANAPPAKGVRVVLVDVPGAAQSQVYVAEEGAPFSAADRIPLHVMNLILGGSFSSRINIDLRETKAYTYGARSAFSMRHGAGPFTAGGAIFAEHTAEAARELLAQIERIRSEPVAATELADAKESARLALPARFEGVDEITGALHELVVYGLPLDEYAAVVGRIDAVSAADVQRVARKWLRPEALHVVVAGDRARVEKDLVAVGPVELRDAYGEPVSN
jgi:predicted Zn-dependent peptidase